MNYRVYYADGSTYTGDPFGAPAFGAIVIVEIDKDTGRRLVAYKDYFVWNEEQERWWATDYIGMIDYLAQSGHKKVLFGRTMPNDDFYALMKRANDDNDFPERTGWGAKEEVLND